MSLPSGESQLLPKPALHRRTLSSFTPLSAGTSRNSSMNGVWAEDYYEPQSLETGGNLLGHKAGTGLALPEPATLSSRASSQFDLSHQGEEDSSSPSRPTRTHQRSLTSLLPFRTKSRENSKSPERPRPKSEQTQRQYDDDDDDDDSTMSTLTEAAEKGVVRAGEKQRGGISSWFSGSSAPISLGIPVTELETGPFNESLAEASPGQESATTKLRKRPNTSSVASPTGNSSNMPTKSPSSAASASSRFNFFQRAPPKQTIQLPERLIEDDELLTLDIHAALLPRPSFSHDAFSPAAYKNLLMTAEGLLAKFQSAYKLRTLSEHELNAEMEAQDEDLEEAEMRAQSLKSQLEEMSERVAEQDNVIEDLVEQLATEKQARAEEKMAHEKSMALARAAEAEELSKKLDQHHRRPRRWRESGGSASTECDSDVELGSPTDSVFSRSRSPAPTITSMLSSATCTSADTTPEILQASFARVVSLQAGAVTQRPNPMVIQATPQQSQQQQKPSSSTPTRLQKILSGISPTATSAGCENCHGADASVAWDTVGLLRAENKGLKEQVSSLESAVEEALNLCSGLGRP